MKKSVFLFVLLCGFVLADAFEKNAFAYDNHGYPCSVTSGCTATCYPDNWNFCKNNCTSYVAYMMNEVYGISDFRNNYKGASWSNGKTWDDAARSVSIPVDNHPLPGDIAFWNSMYDGDPYGHVAFVEKVHFDGNGNAIGIDITQYNINACSFSQEINISPSRPSGFIHILAYNEGVTSLHYIDCYEMGDICNNQTQEEWGRILQRVDQYRCNNCAGEHESYANAFFDGFGGMGSGSDDGVGNVTVPDPSSTSKPELFVKTIEFKDGKTKYYHDENVKINVKVKNTGDDVNPGIDEIKVKLYRFRGEKPDDDPKNWTENIKGENLEHNDTKTEQFEYGAPDPDAGDSVKYQHYACVDTGNAVSESNENNNCLGNIVCRVRKRPNLNLTNLTLDGGRTQFTKGENPYAEGTVVNSGGEPYEDVKMKFYADGNFIGEGNMRAYNLEHNEIKHESTYVFTANLALGSHTFKACADFSKDQDQFDNCREMVFSLVDPPPVPEVNPISPPRGLEVVQ